MSLVIELPCPGAYYLFVASNRNDPHKAEREILRWARQNGYRPHSQTQIFVTFQPDQARQEWRMLERIAE